MRSRTRVLVGIDELYTRQKILDCFAHRDDYELHVFDRRKSEDLESIHNGHYDLYWLEYEDLDFEAVLDSTSKRTLVNSYCVRKGLIRKANLAFNLNKYLAKKSSNPLTKYLPETHIFELDYLDYIDEALNDIFEVELVLKENEQLKLSASAKPTKKYLLKSSMTNKGAEMLLFDTRAQLEAFFRRRVEHSGDGTIDLRQWVVQAYVERPLLIAKYGARKFHLRVYVLAVGNLDVYMYDDMLALFSLKRYETRAHLEDDTSVLDMKMHITNTCFQQEDINNNNVEEDAACSVDVDDYVKRFWQLEFDDDNDIETDGGRGSMNKHAFIHSQIKECVGEIFACLGHESSVFQPLDGAFELYGLDFLVDNNYNCAFLEANAFPDFKQTGPNLNELIECLFYQSVAICCDEFFGKSKVCEPNRFSLVYSNNKKLTS